MSKPRRQDIHDLMHAYVSRSTSTLRAFCHWPMEQTILIGPRSQRLDADTTQLVPLLSGVRFHISLVNQVCLCMLTTIAATAGLAEYLSLPIDLLPRWCTLDIGVWVWYQAIE